MKRRQGLPVVRKPGRGQNVQPLPKPVIEVRIQVAAIYRGQSVDEPQDRLELPASRSPYSRHLRGSVGDPAVPITHAAAQDPNRGIGADHVVSARIQIGNQWHRDRISERRAGRWSGRSTVRASVRRGMSGKTYAGTLASS